MKDIFKSLYIDLIKAKAEIGEIREWRGIKYQKQINGTWKPLRGQNVKKNRYPKLEKSYGINYSQYQNNPIKAIEFLLEKKEGQVMQTLINCHGATFSHNIEILRDIADTI